MASWVQIHNLPFALLTIEMALNIGETVGKVIILKERGEIKGGSFIRVKVQVDITKSLCLGRKISWDKGSEGWAAFKYEWLLNICYWCGHVSHNDKDCETRLGSKDSLQVDDKQFGPWLKASQFNSARKTIFEVWGYED